MKPSELSSAYQRGERCERQKRCSLMQRSTQSVWLSMKDQHPYFPFERIRSNFG